MQPFLTVATALILTVFITACPGKKSDEDSGGNQVATTPLTPIDNSCLTGQANCNTNGYQTYQPYGFRPYPINPYAYGGYWNYWTQYSGFGSHNTSTTLFCDCPIGTMPVYNNQFGLGCVSHARVAPFSGTVGYYNIPGAQSPWVSVPRPNGGPARHIYRPRQQSGPGLNCHTRVAHSCFVQQPNSCMAGQTCRPTMNNSGLGVCVHQGR